MSLKTTIDTQIKAAMLAREQTRLMALRDIKKVILLEETKEGKIGELTAEEEIKLLTKVAKQRRESADIYQQQNRPDLLEKELAELVVIEEFLPKQLSEDELKTRLKEIKDRVGASAPSDMGKMMGVATKELAGIADGKLISVIVKTLLS